MTGSTNFDTKVVRGVTLRSDPAREHCFTIAHLHTEMRLSNDDSLSSQRDRLHRECNQEVLSVEIAAQCLVDFPEAPWELRLNLARQCWDESRHAQLRWQRLIEIGGCKGEFPIINQEWGIVCMLDSLAARLAVQNRLFEGGSLDVLRATIDEWKKAGDERTAEVTDAILVDEIQHVRFGNDWLRQLVAGNPRVLLEIAAGIDHAKRMMAALVSRPGDLSANGLALEGLRAQIKVNLVDRLAAGFTEQEIARLGSEA